jgi:hypothetical protein
MTTALDPERRASLLGAKLAALVARRWGAHESGPAAVASPFPGGAAVQRGDTAWLLLEDQPERSLGPALAWARQREIDELNLLAADHAGLIARRAELFREPPAVWAIDGDGIHPAEAAPFAEPAVPSDAARRAAELLRQSGLDVVIEHGEIAGELRGLEVARVVTDADGSARVEVGVGHHDREAYAMVHADRDPADALRSVVETVAAHRRAGAPSHPLNRMAAERWLRSRLVDEPGLIGAVELYPVEPIVPRGGIKESWPAAAVGVDADGRSVVAVASTGIQLDLVPTAADVRLAYAPDARLVLVLPERDAHPVTHALAAALVVPADIVPIPGDWRAAPSAG